MSASGQPSGPSSDARHSEQLIRVQDQLNPLLADDRANRLPILAALPSDLIEEIREVGFFFTPQCKHDRFTGS